jgi:hypothetical protein
MVPLTYLTAFGPQNEYSLLRLCITEAGALKSEVLTETPCGPETLRMVESRLKKDA